MFFLLLYWSLKFDSNTYNSTRGQNIICMAELQYIIIGLNITPSGYIGRAKNTKPGFESVCFTVWLSGPGKLTRAPKNSLSWKTKPGQPLLLATDSYFIEFTRMDFVGFLALALAASKWSVSTIIQTGYKMNVIQVFKKWIHNSIDFLLTWSGASEFVGNANCFPKTLCSIKNFAFFSNIHRNRIWLQNRWGKNRQ